MCEGKVKISIIVPVYNVEKYLSKCIDSLIQQTFKSYEIILVNDGSQDNSGRICDKYRLLDSRITVIHKENGGLSSARNAGLGVAKGEYIAFVDSDDWVNSDMYEVLYNYGKEYNADIVQCGYKIVFNENEVNNNIIKDEVEFYNNIEAIQKIYSEDNVEFTVSWNKIYKSELFKEIRFPNGKIHEDEYTTYKLMFKCEKIVRVKGEYYYYRQVPESIMNSKYNKKRLDILDALEERSEYFKGIDRQLYLKTIDQYCYKIIQCYSLYKSNNDDNITLLAIKNRAKEFYYKEILRKKVSKKSKVRMILFIFFGINKV